VICASNNLKGYFTHKLTTRFFFEKKIYIHANKMKRYIKEEEKKIVKKEVRRRIKEKVDKEKVI
jgi:hypothetical protein